MSEKIITTNLQFISGYKFRVKFDIDSIPDFFVDEIKPEGESSGPNPTRLLATAVGHCLSSSLIFCLKKSRIPIRDLETKVETHPYRNEKGYLRIKKIEVKISLKIDEKYKIRLSRCLKLFENYCTVTQSVKQGIAVIVNIN